MNFTNRFRSATAFNDVDTYLSQGPVVNEPRAGKLILLFVRVLVRTFSYVNATKYIQAPGESFAEGAEKSSATGKEQFVRARAGLTFTLLERKLWNSH